MGYESSNSKNTHMLSIDKLEEDPSDITKSKKKLVHNTNGDALPMQKSFFTLVSAHTQTH